MPGSTLTVAQALAAGASLPSGTIISDTRANIEANFDALTAIAGKLSAIDLIAGGRPVIALSAAQYANDVPVLGPLITTPVAYGLAITAAQAATTTALPAGMVSAVVEDSAADIQANLAGIEQLFNRKLLGSVRYTDTTIPTLSLSAASVAANISALATIAYPFHIALTDGGTPALTLPIQAQTGSVFTNVISSITTPFTLAFADPAASELVGVINNGISPYSSIYTPGQPVDPIAPLGQQTPQLIPANLTIVDSAASIAVSIAALQVAANAGDLVQTATRFGGAQLIALTPTLYATNAQAIATFTPNFEFLQIITAAQASSPPTLDSRFFGYAVQDTLSAVLGNLAAVTALFTSGAARQLIIPASVVDVVISAAQLGQAASALSYITDTSRVVTLTDGGTPTVTIPAGVLANSNVRGNVLALVTTPYRLAVTGAISATLAADIVAENTSVLANLASVTVYDAASNIATNIAALETLVAKGAITSITLNGTTGIPRLGLSTQAQSTYANVLALINGPFIAGTATSTNTGPISAATFLANLASYEAGVRAGTQGSISLSGPNPVISVSAATLQANLDAFGKLTGSYTIALTDGGTPSITVGVGDSSTANLSAISHISTPYAITFAGPLSAAAAAALKPAEIAALSAPVSIVDTAAGITSSGNLTALEALATAGKLGSISLLNTYGGVPPQLPLSSVAAAGASAVLAAITSPYTLAEVVGASAAATTTIPSGGFQYVAVNDTAANVVANLSALEALAVNGRLLSIVVSDSGTIALSAAQVAADYAAVQALNVTSITLTDGGTPTITLQNWQQNSSFAALGKITTPYTLQIGGQAHASLATSIVNANNTILNAIAPDSLVIRDNATSIAANLTAINTLFTAGKIADIEVSGSAAPLPLTSVQLTQLDAMASVITTPAFPSLIINASNLASLPALGAGFDTYSFQDSVANIIANLPALESLALAGHLGNITPSDAAPSFVVSAATISSNADALATLNAGAYAFALTDSGKPTITLNGAQFTSSVAGNVLNNIDGGYAVSVTSPVSAANAATIVDAYNNVLTNLTGTLVVDDLASNIAKYFDELEYLARLGRIAAVNITDAPNTITVTRAQLLDDTTVRGFLASLADYTPVTTTVTGTGSVPGAISGVPNVEAFAPTAAGGAFFVAPGYQTASVAGSVQAELIDANGGVLLSGGTGNATLLSVAAGVDTLQAGTGNSVLVAFNGGAVMSAAGTSGNNLFFAGVAPATVQGGGGNDISILSDGGLVTTGTAGSQVWLGQGAATIDSNGADTIVAGSGSTTINVLGTAGDLVFGGSGTMSFVGGAVASTVVGLAASITVQAAAGGGVFYGGTAGNNVLTGGSGQVTLVGGGSGDVLTANGSANDVLEASSGNETLTAASSSGTDAFFGGFGDDLMTGGAGTNIFTAGPGAMSITAGGSTNLYVFLDGATSTTSIQGFNPSHDFIHLSGFAAGTAGGVLSGATASGGNTQLSLPDGTTITLVGVAPSALASGNFT